MTNGIHDTKTIKMIMGNQLTDARKKSRLSREKLAQKLNSHPLRPITNDVPEVMKQERIKQWEYGNNPISVEWIPAICDVLSCDVGYLFGEYKELTRAKSDVCFTTGLSQDAVDVLIGMKQAKDSRPISVETSPSLQNVPEQEKAKIISQDQAYTAFYNNLLEFISYLIKSRESSEMTIQEKDGKIKKKTMAVKLSLVSCEEHIQGYVHASSMADHLRNLLTEFPKDDEDAIQRWREMHPNTDDVNRQAKRQRIREEMERQEEQKLIHLWRGSKLMSDLFERFVKEVESNAAKE